MFYKKLEGVNKTVNLGSINLEDAAQYYEWLYNPSEATKIVFEKYKPAFEMPESVDDAKEQLNEIACKKSYSIYDAVTNRLIGLIGIDGPNMNGIGDIWIKMDPSISFDKQIKQGSEAVDTLLSHAFNFLRHNSIHFYAPAFNNQAVAIAEESMLNYSGDRKYASRFEGDDYYNESFYQITKSIYDGKKNIELANPQNIEKTIIKRSEVTNLSGTLKGEKVLLINPESLESKIKNHNRTVLAQYLNNPRVSIPLGEFKTNWNDFTGNRKATKVQYLIIADSKIIGYIDYFENSKNNDYTDEGVFNGTAAWEILVGDTSYQRQGIGYEASNLFIQELERSGQFTNMVGRVFEFNTPSYNLHKKLNFEGYGIQQEGYFAYGKYNNMTLFQVTPISRTRKQ